LISLCTKVSNNKTTDTLITRTSEFDVYIAHG